MRHDVVREAEEVRRLKRLSQMPKKNENDLAKNSINFIEENMYKINEFKPMPDEYHI